MRALLYVWCGEIRPCVHCCMYGVERFTHACTVVCVVWRDSHAHACTVVCVVWRDSPMRALLYVWCGEIHSCVHCCMCGVEIHSCVHCCMCGVERFTHACTICPVQVACALFKVNPLTAFGRLLGAPFRLLKDFVQIMRLELVRVSVVLLYGLY